MTSKVYDTQESGPTSSPFRQTESHGVGPSARTWNEAHLRWLGVDFYADAELWSQDEGTLTLFSPTISIADDSKLGRALEKEFGLPWEDITLHDQGCPIQYEPLLRLDLPLVIEDWNHVSTSSVDPLLRARHPITRTPLSSPLARPAFSPGPIRILPVPSAWTPQHQAPVSEAVRRRNAGSCSSHSYHDPLIKDDPVAPTPGARVVQNTHLSSRTTSSDRTYIQQFTNSSPSSEIIALDMPERDVSESANTFFQAFAKTFVSAAASESLHFIIGEPPTLYIIVEGLRCACSPDNRLAFKPGAISRPVHSWGEYKRLRHGQTEDSIIGQELATLLCIASFYRKGSSGVKTRSQTSRLDAGELTQSKIVYLCSWHHLTAYITRLDISSEALDRISTGDSSSRRQAPLRMLRSRKLDLKNAVDRVDFLKAISAIIIHRMQKHTCYKDVVAELMSIITDVA